MTSGQDRLIRDDCAQQISRISRGHFAPDAAGANYEKVVRVAQFGPTGQTMGASWLELEVLRGRAGT